ARVDWPNLRLALALSPRDVPAAGHWAVFDLRAGLTLEDDFPVPLEPSWPSLERILDDPEVWRGHPQLTPPLRKRLSVLAAQSDASPAQAARLLARLQAGASDSFHLPPAPLRPDSPPAPPLAWDEGLPGAERFASASEAATAFGQRTLFPQLSRAEDAGSLDEAATLRKRVARQQALLDQDEARHNSLARLSSAAEALQIALSGLKTTPQHPGIMLDHPEHGPVEVPLDPRLSPVENMTQLFRQAAKGRRGLAHVQRRRGELAAGTGLELHPARTSGGKPQADRPAPAVLPKRYQGLAVALFRTTDGFLVLRGKSSQANHDMLSKAAGPFDLWFHVAGGPSAHVILKRDYPDQQVPRASLDEAAGLCALKSFRKDDAKAEVL
ncbi:MAG: NFACT RNA binding domain-containing protein, partial [Humidesulfovibrio sp.]|nr:NFACT RNA binding domain-containing protein [Humidesulfovibrio sp.]